MRRWRKTDSSILPSSSIFPPSQAIQNKNCLPGQGAAVLEGQKEPFSWSLAPAQCMQHCQDLPACQGNRAAKGEVAGVSVIFLGPWVEMV